MKTAIRTPVTEAQLQAAVVDLAHILKWRVADFEERGTVNWDGRRR